MLNKEYENLFQLIDSQNVTYLKFDENGKIIYYKIEKNYIIEKIQDLSEYGYSEYTIIKDCIMFVKKGMDFDDIIELLRISYNYNIDCCKLKDLIKGCDL